MWAALFPGQGSQQLGMGKFLYENFTSSRHLFEQASDLLKVDFKKLCFIGPEEDLALTENTQPALLLVSTATMQVVKDTTPANFSATAGHSIGEYAAMVATGALDFAHAIQAVRQRGQFMQSAVPVGEGAMLAVIGLTPEQTVKLCMWTQEESGHGPLEPANFNAPGQIVISGSKKAADWLVKNLNKDIFDPAPKKVRLIPLMVSAPFHCSMMKPAEEKMRLVLEDMTFAQAQLPVIQNVCAEPVTQPEALRENLIQQVSAPVRWVECVEKLAQMGVSQCVELGSGKVLAGLVKKIAGEKIQCLHLNSLDDLKAVEAAMT